MQNHNQYAELIANQRKFWDSGATRTLKFRTEQLRTLRAAFDKHRSRLEQALYADLRKSPTEAFTVETGVIMAEIDHILSRLRYWMRPEWVHTPLIFMPGNSKIYHEPYGVTLVISPWNYPIKNAFGPVLGAISSGNCCIIKPSEVSSNCSRAIAEMVKEFFNPEYLAVVEGGVPETTELLENKFDFILYTGNTAVGKIIYAAAAKNLTPVALELGGKSPVIVDQTADLDVTAKRLCWGKFLNVGQTCVAPDYLLVHRKVKSKLIQLLVKYIEQFYGADPSLSKDLGRIINTRHFERVKALIHGNIVHGGQVDCTNLYIAPTIIDEPSVDHPVMQEEIFGPIIPVIGYDDIAEAIQFINSREKPLALYLFSNDQKVRKKVIRETSSGGITINETIMHMGSFEMPFGGVGNSGFGSYNGKHGFTTFSHRKPVLTKSFLFDFTPKYAPITQVKNKVLQLAIKYLT